VAVAVVVVPAGTAFVTAQRILVTESFKLDMIRDVTYVMKLYFGSC
jgi:hypothetical protein